MKRRMTGILAVAAGLVLYLHALAAWPPAITLEDQYRQAVSLSDVLIEPAVLVYSDRQGASQARDWLELLRDQNCVLIEAANLSSAPAIARPFVRRRFVNGTPVLMDWRGELAEALGFVDDQVNPYLLGATDRFAHWHGELTIENSPAYQSRLEEFCNAVD